MCDVLSNSLSVSGGRWQERRGSEGKTGSAMGRRRSGGAHSTRVAGAEVEAMHRREALHEEWMHEDFASRNASRVVENEHGAQQSFEAVRGKRRRKVRAALVVDLVEHLLLSKARKGELARRQPIGADAQSPDVDGRALDGNVVPHLGGAVTKELVQLLVDDQLASCKAAGEAEVAEAGPAPVIGDAFQIDASLNDPAAVQCLNFGR